MFFFHLLNCVNFGRNLLFGLFLECFKLRLGRRFNLLSQEVCVGKGMLLRNGKGGCLCLRGGRKLWNVWESSELRRT